MKMKKFDAVIIGGGIHGCSIALHLAKIGLNLALIEKDRVGQHASGVNAGGVRRLGRDYEEIPIAQLASKLWHNIEELTEDRCGFQVNDQIKVAESDRDLTKIKLRIKQLNNRGFFHEESLDRQELFKLLPELSSHCLGGMIVRGDGYANPYQATQAFKRRAVKLGVKLFEKMEVLSVTKVNSDWHIQTKGELFMTKVVVNCSGAWGNRIAQMLGDIVHLTPKAPMLMITSPLPRFVRPVVGSFSRVLSFKQFTNGTVMIGGGLLGLVKGPDLYTEIDLPQLSEYAKSAAALFPIMETATLVRSWAGIEGYTPDNLPIVGTGQRQGVFHAFGFSAHGFQLAPAIGQVMSELICNGHTRYSLDAFRVDRFTNAYAERDATK